MKKIFFLALFFVTLTSLSAQELIALGGYGYNQADSVNKGDFTFCEARLMFNLTENVRAGIYGGYVGYGNIKTNVSMLRGTEWKYGLSLDSYGGLTYSYSYYGWINSGLKNTVDQYQESYYRSKTLTNEFFVSGGLSVTDDWQGWFGHNQIMFDYQKPTSEPKVSATWKDKPVTSTPYNKESFRITLESGVKRFGSTLNIEPIIKLGYGHDYGRQKSYYEYGGGLGFGVYKDWYREIFKITVFQRNDFGAEFNNINSVTPGGRIGAEITFNAASLYKLITNK